MYEGEKIDMLNEHGGKLWCKINENSGLTNIIKEGPQPQGPSLKGPSQNGHSPNVFKSNNFTGLVLLVYLLYL